MKVREREIDRDRETSNMRAGDKELAKVERLGI